jgi:hypothetical protein
MRCVGRGVPRAYCPPIQCMPACMPRLGRCLWCFVTPKLLNSPRVLWRGWIRGGPAGQGVGWMLVGGWMGQAGPIAQRATCGRMQGGLRVG